MTAPTVAQIAGKLTKAQREALLLGRWIAPGGQEPFVVVALTPPWPPGICQFFTLHSDRLTDLGVALWRALQAAEEWRCGNSATGFHVVDTSMESGYRHCFACEKPMPMSALTVDAAKIIEQENPR